MLKVFLISATIILTLSSCKGTGDSYQPIVDRPGPNYQYDLTQCRQLAQQKQYFSNSTGRAAAGGAVTGGALGGALTALSGGGLAQSLGGVAIGAAAGSVIGAGGETAETSRDKEYIIVRCLQGRGYNVIM